jgi:nucleotide-binding universal stress UspA family protein
MLENETALSAMKEPEEHTVVDHSGDTANTATSGRTIMICIGRFALDVLFFVSSGNFFRFPLDPGLVQKNAYRARMTPVLRGLVRDVDPSDASRHAFQWSKDTLLRPDDKIVLVSVRPVQQMIFGDLRGDFIGALRTLEDAARNQAHTMLQGYGAELKRSGMCVRAIAIRGEPRADLIRKASDLKADLVVIGSRGLGAVKRALLGSVSTHVVHHAPCPVVVVRPQESQ